MAQDYIACCNFEETIKYFGTGNTPEQALSDFISGGCFAEYCEQSDIKQGSQVTVKVFTKVSYDSPEANLEDFEDGWDWMIGEEVSSQQILYS